MPMPGYQPNAGLWSGRPGCPSPFPVFMSTGAAASVPRIAARGGVVATAANPFELHTVKRPDHFAFQHQLGHGFLHMHIIPTIADMPSYSLALMIGSQNDSLQLARLSSTHE